MNPADSSCLTAQADNTNISPAASSRGQGGGKASAPAKRRGDLYAFLCGSSLKTEILRDAPIWRRKNGGFFCVKSLCKHELRLRIAHRGGGGTGTRRIAAYGAGGPGYACRHSVFHRNSVPEVFAFGNKNVKKLKKIAAPPLRPKRKPQIMSVMGGRETSGRRVDGGRNRRLRAAACSTRSHFQAEFIRKQKFPETAIGLVQ
jgi:hypothetical protein